MPLRPSTRTLSILVAELQRIFGDEAGVQLQQSDIVRWANSAQQEIVTVNKVLKAKSSITATIGTADYTFPDYNIQQVEALHWNNALIPNYPFATAERVVQASDPSQLQTGDPQLWYEWDGTFTLWPVPDSAGTITLYYTEYPTLLTGDTSQVLAVPDKYFNAVVDYCLSKAYELDEDYQASQMAEQRFRAALEQQTEEERQGQNMVYPVIQDVVSEGYYR